MHTPQSKLDSATHRIHVVAIMVTCSVLETVQNYYPVERPFSVIYTKWIANAVSRWTGQFPSYFWGEGNENKGLPIEHHISCP